VWLRSIVRNSCFNVGSPRVAIILWKGPAEFVRFCKGCALLGRSRSTLPYQRQIPLDVLYICYSQCWTPVVEFQSLRPVPNGYQLTPLVKNIFKMLFNDAVCRMTWHMNECGTMVEWYWQELAEVLGENCPTVSLCTTNRTWTGLGLNPVLCWGSHDTVS